MATPWSYFDRFEKYCDTYLPPSGEGETMASQAVTAVTKLVYKWYNDGDVYDNTYQLEGWANDLSDYANWLYMYYIDAPLEIREILDRISTVSSGDEYEDDILRPLADLVFRPESLRMLAAYPKKGSIYDCQGPFEFDNSYDDEDEWDDDEDEWEDE